MEESLRTTPPPPHVIVQIFSIGILCGLSLRMTIGFCLRYS
ncbi:hypothetical protein NC652_017003 [Populus alba x Populus x berolinensis]|nr:hypothetical protein NC652_017003 [Populus alba x Populus x berolinensis]